MLRLAKEKAEHEALMLASVLNSDNAVQAMDKPLSRYPLSRKAV